MSDNIVALQTTRIRKCISTAGGGGPKFEAPKMSVQSSMQLLNWGRQEVLSSGTWGQVTSHYFEYIFNLFRVFQT